MTNSIKIENALSVENCVVGNDTLLLCKMTAHKWLITNSVGGVLFTSKTKKAAVAEIDELRKAAVKAATAVKKATPKKASPKVKRAADRATKKAKPAASKPTTKKPAVKTNKNVNKFTFGSKIDVDTVMGYAAEIWGDTLELSNVEFVDSHYWKGTVANQEGSTVDNVRLDYVINFARIPTALKSDAVVKQQHLVLGK